jgi:septum formation protein
MEKIKYKLILGSQSPRRKELLRASFINFDIITSNIEEISHKEEISEIVMDLANQKASAVLEKCRGEYENPLVLGSDTIVVIENEILGKPKSRSEAREMLLKLSGKKHKVLTGVSLVSLNKTIQFFDETIVEFEDITEDLMELYLDTEESMDKAGAYGIQAFALAFIKRVEGSYSSVVGLPVNLVIQKLKEFNMGNTNWRDSFES